ncbi:hypothetical protein [Methylobacterium organophilum]|uniref:Uncharacterized protein n=1 Tax=Methylobacterium organophilum TaxID=410 RepID=A0ABQ4TGR0_METOR|nr:hypothetical protein [Methylobacterium organophilum]UMY17385.1 hypothetical protein MMB17_22635 [Methylobacterium organophilum]GJE29227.1 hypothetical protein LKMONMHP_4106 [Methylobacterium organophilum]
MDVNLRSLSDFKRFLRTPGATIQIVHNTLIERQSEEMQAAYRRKGMYEPRTVHALSKKAAVFAVRGHDTNVWLYWDKGTRKWRFSGDTVAVPLHAALGPADEVVYRCSLNEALPEPATVPSSVASRGKPGAAAAKRLREARRTGAPDSEPPSFEQLEPSFGPSYRRD